MDPFFGCELYHGTYYLRVPQWDPNFGNYPYVPMPYLWLARNEAVDLYSSPYMGGYQNYGPFCGYPKY